MKQGVKQLILQTGSHIAGLMIWVIISSLMPFIRADLKLSTTQVAFSTAIPIILGSLLRVPIGYWTNRYGARTIFAICFIFLLVPITIISLSKSIVWLIIGCSLLGISGSVFSIGVTSLPKYFQTTKQGLINGIYGAGNIGTALTIFSAPVLARALGWRSTVQMYLIIALIFAILNLIYGEPQLQTNSHSISKDFKNVFKNYKLLFLSLFYFLTFGSFVSFTIYLPPFLVNHFELNMVDAGLRTAVFIVIATLFRPIGGWLADKLSPYFFLILVFLGLAVSGFLLSFTPSLPLYSLGCVLVAFCAGIGNGIVFKLVPMYFPNQNRIVNGIVSAIGGLGGFFPPVILAIFFNLTGNYEIGFMALSEFSLTSLILVIWLLYLDKIDISSKIMDHTKNGICITDFNGIIQKVNPAFTRITGFHQKEVIGKTPSVLQSGEHDNLFYQAMWIDLKTKGYWEGFIWNKRKNKEIYKEWLTITAIKDDSGETRNYVGMFTESH